MQIASSVPRDVNLLTAIIRYAELALDALPAEAQERADLQEIDHAATWAAQLTRQLLAFARQQRIEPRIFSPNELLSGPYQLLGRLIGEDIELVTLASPELYSEPGGGTAIKSICHVSRAGSTPCRAELRSCCWSRMRRGGCALVARVLGNLGYTVLEASEGGEALRLVKDYSGRAIDLLLTDGIMPLFWTGDGRRKTDDGGRMMPSSILRPSSNTERVCDTLYLAPCVLSR